MTKSDFNSDFENNRQAIEIEEETPEELPSRVQIHQHKKKAPKRPEKGKRKGLTLINVILVLFTLIPIGIFVYVLSDLYNPKQDNTVNVDKAGVTLEIDKDGQGDSAGTDTGKDENEGTPDAGDSESESDSSKGDSGSTATPGQDNAAAEKPAEKPAAQPEKKPEAKPETKPEVKPETKPQTESKPATKPDPKPETKPETKPDPKPSGKTHTVGPNETLYRISVNYYGSGNYVDKIKAANGLTSNSISVGQTLILP